jgi:hypothetical protein
MGRPADLYCLVEICNKTPFLRGFCYILLLAAGKKPFFVWHQRSSSVFQGKDSVGVCDASIYGYF